MSTVRAVEERRIDVGGVPARVYDPGAARGLLLLGHGGGQSKDGGRFVSLSRQYASLTDLAVVCIDAVDHGERKPSSVSPGLPSRWHSTAMDQMVADWSSVAASLSMIGAPVAYVGFSMGMIFGAPTVAALPTITAAVFGVGGIPSGGWTDDPPLRQKLLDAASGLADREVLMLNMTRDTLFPLDGTLEFFHAIPGARKRLALWENDHDTWPPEAIDTSIEFIRNHTR